VTLVPNCATRDGVAWAELTPLERHAGLVHATALVSGGAPLFSHHSAAAVRGLPIIGTWPTRVDVITAGTNAWDGRRLIGILGRFGLVPTPRRRWL
jgi:hypothetical protein